MPLVGGVSKLKNSEKRQIVGAAGISFPLRAADFQFLPAPQQAAITYRVSCCNAAGKNARSSYDYPVLPIYLLLAPLLCYLVFLYVFSDYGRVLCTNKRLYVRLSRTGSRKT